MATQVSVTARAAPGNRITGSHRPSDPSVEGDPSKLPPAYSKHNSRPDFDIRVRVHDPVAIQRDAALLDQAFRVPGAAGHLRQRDQPADPDPAPVLQLFTRHPD